ncbi:MAG TPA: hypothetical protein PKE26_02975 [Kiritimatiellia bacterium]|nr:hypothetical protein [Kiritimatiellia bacterium]HMO98052.1 hypothetical protein [Kiritimatiellia bacterium]HMP96998.1 hypothetical protein [Kiritimatiellia bacterium]
MRYSIILCLLGASFLARATTPEELVTRYFEAFKKGDMEAVAGEMHLGELTKFKDTLLPVLEQTIVSSAAGPGRDELMIRQFTNRDDMETIREESPRAFFVRFMRWVMKLNPMMSQTMSAASIETLGHIIEKDMAHVVYRIHIDMMGAKVSQLNVMSVKKEDEAWRLMMTGEIEGMGKMLQQNMNRF